MDKQVGERIRKFRVLKNLSQENVADALGMSTGNYGKYERGEISITLSQLQEIAKFFKVAVSELIEDQPYSTSEIKKSYGFVTHEEFQTLINDIRQLMIDVEKLKKKLK